MTLGAVRKAIQEGWIRRLGRDTGYALIATITTVAAEKLLLNPFLVRVAGYELFGSFLLARYWITIALGFVSAGLYLAILRQYPKQPESGQPPLFATACLIAAALMAVLYLLVDLFETTLGTVYGDALFAHFLREFALFGLVSSFATILLTYFRANLQLRRFYSFQTLMGLLLLLAIPVYYIFGPRHLPLGYVLAAVATSWLALRKVGRKALASAKLSKAAFAVLLRDMWPLGASPTLLHLSRAIDKLLLGGLVGASAAGEYFALTSVAVLMQVPVEAFTGVLLAYLVGNEFVPREKRWRLAAASGAGVLSASILFLGLLLGPLLTDVLYGPGTFASQPRVFYIFLVGAAISASGIVFTPLLVLHHSTWTLPSVYLVTSAVTVATALFLSRLMDPLTAVAIGAAAGLAIRGVVCSWLGLSTKTFETRPADVRAPVVDA